MGRGHSHSGLNAEKINVALIGSVTTSTTTAATRKVSPLRRSRETTGALRIRPNSASSNNSKQSAIVSRLKKQ